MSKNKAEQKVVQKIANAVVKTEQKRGLPRPRKSMMSKVYDYASRAMGAVKQSTISVNTPFGSIGYGTNGIVMNPPGFRGSESFFTTAEVGKRSYYMTTHAPKIRGYTSGLRVVAAQFFCSAIVNPAGPTADVFAPGGAASNYVELSPDNIGGQIATDARNYNRYRFVQAALEYIPAVAVGATSFSTATALPQHFSIGYTSDAAAVSFETLSHQSIQAMADSTTCMLWAKGGLIPLNLGTSQNLYYTEFATTNTATTRQTAQGLFAAAWNTNPTGTGTPVVGEFVFHYILDLYDRSADYGFTITVDDTIGYDVLMYIFQKYGDKLSRRDRNRLLRRLSPPPAPDEMKELLSLCPRSESPDLVHLSPDGSLVKPFRVEDPLIRDASTSVWKPVEKKVVCQK